MRKIKKFLYIFLSLACVIIFNQCSGFNAAHFDSSSLLSLSSSIQCKPGESSSFPRRAWRLTGQQYVNTVKAVFSSAQNVNNPFNSESSPGAFNNNANGLNLGKLLTSNLIAENEKVAQASVAGLVQTYPCLASAVDAACASSVVKGLTPKLFRKLVSAEELSSYSQFLMSSVSSYGNTDGVSVFVQGLLLSPNFLYRYEVGDRITGYLDSYEKAALISYSSANTAPDAELLSAAQSNSLQTREQIKSHFIRMAKKNNQYDVLIDFFRQYLHYDALTAKTKDTNQFPDYNAQVGQALVNETDALILDLMRSGTGSIKELLSTDTIMVQPLTAKIYAGNYGSLQNGVITRAKDPSRAGLLTQPSFLATMGTPTRTSPVKIGKTIRMSFLCTKVPEAPPGVPTIEELPASTYPTQRAKLAAHMKPVCASCHKYMDPLGLGFENFDAVGTIRTTENGQAVNDSGEVTYTNSDIDGPFNGGAALGRKLASSEVVRACIMKNSFLYVTGQVNENGSECFVENVRRASNYKTDSADMVGVFADLFAEFLTSPRFGALEN